jgi:hypothetical protein
MSHHVFDLEQQTAPQLAYLRALHARFAPTLEGGAIDYSAWGRINRELPMVYVADDRGGESRLTWYEYTAPDDRSARTVVVSYVLPATPEPYQLQEEAERIRTAAAAAAVSVPDSAEQILASPTPIPDPDGDEPPTSITRPGR